jgi:hypothetical protein
MIFFAQAATSGAAAAGAHAGFNWTISLGDIAQALSLPLSLLIAWLTIKVTLSAQRRDSDDAEQAASGIRPSDDIATRGIGRKR